ncbi:MAG: DUF6056 family protein [Candidatus Moraniibacteriota bacterium]
MIKTFFKKSDALVSFLMLVAVFVIFYLLNKRTPIWSDDWAFYFAYGEKRVEHFSDVLASLPTFYFGLNGRSVANFLIELFVLWGKPIFAIFNALMFVLLGVAIYFFSSEEKKLKPVGLLGIFSLLWFCLPAPNQTLFWMCGSVVYLWMAVLGLMFLWPYKKLLIEKQDLFLKKSLGGICLMFLLGFFAGNSHELLAPIILFLSFLGSLVFWKQKQLFLHWSISGVVGVFGGLSVQLLAPGNFIKFGTNGQTEKIAGTISHNLTKLIPGAPEHQSWLWIIAGAIFCVYFLDRLLFRKRGIVIDRVMQIALVTAIALDALSIFFPYFPPRAYFFSSIFLIIFASRFLLQTSFWKIKYALVLAIFPVLAFSVQKTLVESDALAKEYAQRENSISTQKADNKKDIMVERIGRVKNEKLLGETLSRHNHLGASRFYGVDSITIK